MEPTKHWLENTTEKQFSKAFRFTGPSRVSRYTTLPYGGVEVRLRRRMESFQRPTRNPSSPRRKNDWHHVNGFFESFKISIIQFFALCSGWYCLVSQWSRNQGPRGRNIACKNFRWLPLIEGEATATLVGFTGVNALRSFVIGHISDGLPRPSIRKLGLPDIEAFENYFK